MEVSLATVPCLIRCSGCLCADESSGHTYIPRYGVCQSLREPERVRVCWCPIVTVYACGTMRCCMTLWTLNKSKRVDSSSYIPYSYSDLPTALSGRIRCYNMLYNLLTDNSPVMSKHTVNLSLTVAFSITVCTGIYHSPPEHWKLLASSFQVLFFSLIVSDLLQ